MIASLRGELFSKTSNRMIVDVNGVGYEVFYSQATFSRLPEIGEEVFLYVFTDVREDALNLYGFIEEDEKEMFLLLVKVSGVGPKLAINMLSGASPREISRAIIAEDITALVGLSGVGKKTAQRLCVELKDKVHFEPEAAGSGLSSQSIVAGDEQRTSDVISALVNLGYPSFAAHKALEKVRQKNDLDNYLSLSLEELLRQALRAMA